MIITPRQLLDRFGGLARGRQLTKYGLTRFDLANAANEGEIRRLRRGVYATNQASAAMIAAAQHGGALTCSNALAARGVWVLRGEAVPHVWMGSTGRVHPHEPCRCVVHYHPGRMQLGLTDVANALIHSYFCHGEEFFFAALESAWRRQLISADDRARIRRALPSSAKWLVDFAKHDADSGLESLLRLRLHLQGIEVQTQVWIDGVGKVDFVIDGRLIIESDGKENHDAEDKRHKDLLRDAVASALGYESLRFDYDLILSDWQKVFDAILGALHRARG